MNEVPRAGGGFYWDQDSPDHRDQALLRTGEDRAREIKVSALAELIEKIRERQWLREKVTDQSASNLAQQLLDDLRRTQFMEIGGVITESCGSGAAMKKAAYPSA
jgi:diaminopimelate epimerase